MIKSLQNTEKYTFVHILIESLPVKRISYASKFKCTSKKMFPSILWNFSIGKYSHHFAFKIFNCIVKSLKFEMKINC